MYNKDIRNPEIGEVFLCEQTFGNLHDPYAESVIHEDNIIVGQSIEQYRLCYFFYQETK